MRTMNSVADRDSQHPVCVGSSSGRRTLFSRAAWVWIALIFGSSLLVLRLVQIGAGAPHAAFGEFSDEPAHYVAGLLVHDYVPRVFHESPLQFVQHYHTRLPYLGLGVWPPLFYA